MPSAGSTGSPPLPRHLQLEVTSACNLSCAMCLVSYRPAVNRAEGAMSIELFRRLLDGTPGLTRLTLQGLGEPLLQPHLPAMIAEAKERGIEVGFNSNAMLLTRERADRLVALGLDWLHVSLDGATAATYEGIRAGGDFGKVARNLRGLQAAKRAAGSATPWVRVVFVAMRRNVAELPGVVRLAADWGVPTLRVQNLSHSFDDTDPAGAYREIREFAAAEALWQSPDAAAERAFADAARAAEERGVALRLPKLEAPSATRASNAPGCDWPWRSAYVRQDGQVQPCCMLMGGDRGILGDLAAESFPAVWRGERYEAFRAGLMSSRPPDVCAGCSMYRGVF